MEGGCCGVIWCTVPVCALRNGETIPRESQRSESGMCEYWRALCVRNVDRLWIIAEVNQQNKAVFYINSARKLLLASMSVILVVKTIGILNEGTFNVDSSASYQADVHLNLHLCMWANSAGACLLLPPTALLSPLSHSCFVFVFPGFGSRKPVFLIKIRVFPHFL
jgi:hypothetical protein